MLSRPMLLGMGSDEPPPLPPREPPREPFVRLRTPPHGTLAGVQRPPLLPPRPPAPAAAAGQPSAELLLELERHVEGLRLELAVFREWLPAQLSRPGPRPSAIPPPLGAQLRPQLALARRLARAAAFVLLALALAWASAVAALRWAPYGELVLWSARPWAAHW